MKKLFYVLVLLTAMPAQAYIYKADLWQSPKQSLIGLSDMHASKNPAHAVGINHKKWILASAKNNNAFLAYEDLTQGLKYEPAIFDSLPLHKAYLKLLPKMAQASTVSCLDFLNTYC